MKMAKMSTQRFAPRKVTPSLICSTVAVSSVLSGSALKYRLAICQISFREEFIGLFFLGWHRRGRVAAPHDWSTSLARPVLLLCFLANIRLFLSFATSKKRKELRPVGSLLSLGHIIEFLFSSSHDDGFALNALFSKKNAPILFPLPMPRSGRRCRDKFTCKTGVDFLLHFSPSPRKKTCLVRKTCDAAAGEGEGGR